ncbi:MAG: anaerobic ribonucleoside-triphosphate reductase activating protein [Firmicutes bacterium]|nr:anaerobic ribonucleoside-triphosphate reductase activating protein [Bacillota bacterium]MBQ7241886.1 anaerobic ribonucleoside-triphosphate reductase activating protein [Bacillota bacterium]
MQIRMFGYSPESIVDGKGFRFSIFVQGCLMDCPDCHNPESHDLNGGYFMDTEALIKEISENPLLDGVTFSGGEPFLQPEPLTEIAEAVKKMNLNIWIYSGYTFEDILASGDEAKINLLRQADVLVDGPFKKDERSLELKFKGSRNQRLIDVKKSLDAGEAILFEL